MNYLTTSIALDGVIAEEVKENLDADTDEELQHARRIGELLKQFDEAPPSSSEFEVR